MPVEIEYLDDEKIVLLKNIGDLSWEEHQKATDGAINLMKSRKVKSCLIDNTQLANRLSIIDIYEFPKLYQSKELDPTYRAAVLISGKNKIDDETRFYETVCLNRGYQIRIFTDRKDAVAWLKGFAGGD